MSIGVGNPRTMQVRNQVVGASANLDVALGDVVAFDATMDSHRVPDVDDVENLTADTSWEIGVVTAAQGIPFGGYGPVATGGIIPAVVAQDSSDAVAVGDLLAVDTTTDVLRFIKATLATDGVVDVTDLTETAHYMLDIRARAMEAGTTGSGEETLDVKIINNPVNFG